MISIYWDKWIIDGSVNFVAMVARVLSIPVRWLQTGRVSSYAGFIVLGVLLLDRILFARRGLHAGEPAAGLR